MGRVIVFGSVSQDLVLSMPRRPTSGETLIGSDIITGFGGKGANQAVAAALAGAETLLVGRVGDDAVGREYLQRLAEYGVDVSRMETDVDAPTGSAIIYVNGEGDNMIVVAPGANARMTAADLTKIDDLGEDDILLMPLESPHEVVIAAAAQAYDAGARVVLNLAPYADVPAETLEQCDPVVVNEHEAALLEDSGASAPSLLVTLGPLGAKWGEIYAPAEQVSVTDTTGAGDCYCGTLAARLALGDDREDAMRAASAASAVNVQHAGAQPPLAGT